MLKALEDFLLKSAPTLLGLSTEKPSSHYSIEIKSKSGDEKTRSVAELHHLPDDVKSVELDLGNYSLRNSIRIRFGDTTLGDGITIRTSGQDARARAKRVETELLDLLSVQGQPNHILHPLPWMAVAAYMLLAFLGPGALAVYLRGQQLAAWSAAALVIVLLYLLLIALRPYHYFDTRRNQLKLRIARTVGMIVGTVGLGMLGNYLYDLMV